MKSQSTQHAQQLVALAKLEVGYTRRIIMAKLGAWERRENLQAAEMWLTEQMVYILGDLYRRTMPTFGAIVLDGLKGAADYETKRDANFWMTLASQWLTQFGAVKAKQISRTTILDIQEVLRRTTEEGEGQTGAAKAIRLFTGLSRERAKIIARTESHNAAMFASKETVKDYSKLTGLTAFKKWTPTFDGRTREDHAAMAGRPAIGMDAKFNVGGEQMDRPGDPRASAEQVVNCRCVLTYTDDFDLLFAGY